MGLITSNDFPSLQALYTAQLRYLLPTEQQIVEGLPDMEEHADDPRLKQAFRSHLQETELHVSRLKQLIGDLKDDVDDKKDPILTAIAGSGKNISKGTDSGPIRDAGLIATAQKIEHYEIASYGSARDWAVQLGLNDHAAILQGTLEKRSTQIYFFRISHSGQIETHRQCPHKQASTSLFGLAPRRSRIRKWARSPLSAAGLFV
jgi:ferritin-like metal-binding protein YciE